MELIINTGERTISIKVDKTTSAKELVKNLEHTLKVNNLGDFKIKSIKTKTKDNV